MVRATQLVHYQPLENDYQSNKPFQEPSGRPPRSRYPVQTCIHRGGGSSADGQALWPMRCVAFHLDLTVCLARSILWRISNKNKWHN